VLSLKRCDEARALIVINAAAALFVGGKSETLSDAARLAEESINSGAAGMKLEQLIKATN
jgi:anthranilate phosphoribosyltransferase